MRHRGHNEGPVGVEAPEVPLKGVCPSVREDLEGENHIVVGGLMEHVLVVAMCTTEANAGL